MRRRLVTSLLVALAIAPAACGKLQGFGGPSTPLVSFDATFSGDVTQLRPPGITSEKALSIALVWGDQWLTEPFCLANLEPAILPANPPLTEPTGSSTVADVIKQGCRDPFGFVPAAVAASVPIAASGPTTISLQQLPTADVMVGDVTARVAYGSFVLFDDRDGDGVLDLAFPHRLPSGDRGGRMDMMMIDTPDSPDIVYGASFWTMTAADQRASYHEGGPIEGDGFYPRAGCLPLADGFQVVRAGGFSVAAAVTATLAGQLPTQDPTTCFAASPDAPDATVAITAMAPADVEEVSCDERTVDSSVRYRQPPDQAPDLTDRIWTCAHLPTFDTSAQPSTLIQLVVSGRSTDRCKGLTHYVLRGCDDGSVTCALPWDFTKNPPAWWMCPQ